MIWQFLLASVALTLLPGPDILFVLTQSIGRGARAAFSVALGLCSGLIFHTTAVACGVAVLVAGSPVLFTILKYCGAAYLVWLGIKAILGSFRSVADEAVPDESDASTRQDKLVGRRLPQVNSFGNLYRQGITMNLLNPKVILFFLSFLPGFVPADSPSPTWNIVGLGALFAAQAIVVFGCVSILGGWLSRRLRIERYAQSTGFAVVAAVLYLAIAVMIVL